MKVICLVGPTAVGKSALGLELAAHLGGELISADSRQIYRHLDIGTAKPAAAERARVPHHCLDLVEPGLPFDAARFRAAAAEAIADIHRRGRVPLVVGGTGLYLRVLLHGLCAAPPRVPRLRTMLSGMVAARGAPALHQGLAALDPVTAARIGPRDAVRIVRALEVGLATGRPLSTWQAAHRFAETPYEVLLVGLVRPVAELDARIERRVRAMVAAGFLDEVRALGARGLDRDAPGLRAVGYREMLGCLEGRLDVEGAVAATVLATRQFAKRQRTWFRREPDIRWRHPDDDRSRIGVEAEAFLAGTAPPAPVTA